MHWRIAGGLLLSLCMATGCPHSVSKEGFTNRAMRADIRDRVVQECPDQIFNLYCTNDRHTTRGCIEQCAAAISAQEEEDE
ncbi:hypothetical protein [Pyxidicoccus sp. MSG2]|uniref:hypothetical protein n=1 Tax=Pyxidicoccus sp. MSG2 TaxID=2996790 RepID=UPI00227089A5|nr:hypothetical protein [Pyxidicoccus sp. MSG2]MCY1014409.1 hypothetical protein [Pyxidicoccus sp. MSG2]